MDKTSRRLTILGSTGSIGAQTLQVAESLAGSVEIAYLTANKSIELLEEQALKFRPAGVVITDENAFWEFKRLSKFKGEILFGDEGLHLAASSDRNDLVLSALVGFSGVIPTLSAINAGTNVALANKETLVSAGKIVTEAAVRNNVKIIAVDSEHSAILQCLVGEQKEEIEKIILTASGGPFRETPYEQFQFLTVEEALAHPNWSMGNKISIDSATMMNKGLEIIEAHWLFGVPVEKIDVVVHPQSIVHSAVQFVDGSIKAQLGAPDMRLPISYALNYPQRLKFDFPRIDLSEIGSLTFFKPDFKRFRCLTLAYRTINLGGAAPAALNAANETAVSAFLSRSISFNAIPDCIEFVLENIEIVSEPNLEQTIATDKTARQIADEYISRLVG